MDVRSSRHSSRHLAHATGLDNDVDDAPSCQRQPSHQRARSPSQERSTSRGTPRRHGKQHGERHGGSQRRMDRRRDDDSLTLTRHRHDRKQAKPGDYDEDSQASDGQRHVHSTPSSNRASRHLCNGDVKSTHAPDNDDADMEDLVAQMLKLTVAVEQLIKMRNSPSVTTPRDKDCRGRHKGQRTDESNERRHRHSSDERQSRPRDDDSDDDDRGKHSLHKRHESTGSRTDRHNDKSADDKQDKSSDNGNGKKSSAQRLLEERHSVTRT